MVDYDKALKTACDKDLDAVLRTAVNNYTLSLEQIVSLTVQIIKSDAEGNLSPLPHLVSKGFLETYEIDPAVCGKFILPVPGEKPVWLFKSTNERVDSFPSYKKLVYLVKTKPRKLGEIIDLVSKKTHTQLQMVTISIENDERFMKVDNSILIDRSVSTFDLVYILQQILIQAYLNGGGDPLVGALAKKLLNLYACVPQPVDLSGVDALPADDLFKKTKLAMDIFRDVMWIIAPTFTLNEIATLIKVYKPDMRKPDLIQALKGADQSLAGKLQAFDGMSVNKIINLLKTARITYTPVVII